MRDGGVGEGVGVRRRELKEEEEEGKRKRERERREERVRKNKSRPRAAKETKERVCVRETGQWRGCCWLLWRRGDSGCYRTKNTRKLPGRSKMQTGHSVYGILHCYLSFSWSIMFTV